MASRNLSHAATLLPLAIGLAMNARSPTTSKTSTSASPHRTAVTRSQPGGGAGQPFTLPAACSLPYNGMENPDIDARCPSDGGGSTPAKQAQSRAKNNLCAASGPARRITYDELKQKQAQANAVNVTNLTDRSPLTALGEGTYVEYIAFIQDAHFSDVKSGEAVNCNIPGDSTNDIHIVLVQDPNDDPCNSTTAEMIPHYRPAAWTADNVLSVKEHPVRVRGPLFYDDAHKPCSGSSRPSPNRISVWEVHPVYSMDACRSDNLAECQNSTNPSDWIALEDWLNGAR